MLSPIDLSSCFIIERAHRIPSRALPPGAPPRPFIMKVLNYRDAILMAARKKEEIKFDYARLSFYPDFTAEVQKKWRPFTQVRSHLRELGLKYAMLYPLNCMSKIKPASSTHQKRRLSGRTVNPLMASLQ